MNRQEQLECLEEAEASAPTEIWLREALIFLAGILLSYALANLAFLFWGAAYVVLDRLYITVIRRAVRSPTALNFWLAHGFALAVSVWIIAVAVYVAWMGTGEYLALSAYLLVGPALHCISSHWRFSLNAVIDLLCITLGSFGIAAASIYHKDAAELDLAIMLGAIAVLTYFAHSFRKIVQQRMELRARIAGEQEAQRIQAIGKMTGGVAHDFNNLLTVIGGNIELARLQPLPESVQSLLASAQDSTADAAKLVAHLLAYAQKSHLNPVAVPCTQVFTTLAEAARPVMPDTIELAFVAPPPSFYVRADPHVLSTALMNLVSNARDAIGDTAGTITVEAVQAAGSDMIDLIVRDTGPGMDQAVLAQAPEPFFTTKNVGSGSGLGLSMVQGFAEQSGGRLTLANRAPTGLSATLSLPMAEDGSADPQ